MARVVNAAKAKGQVIFVLFPNGNGRAPELAKYYSGDYQDEVRQAIRSAINVPIVDLDGKGLASDGIHGTPAAYKAAGEEVLSLIKGTQKVDKKPSAKENTAPAIKHVAPPGAVANLLQRKGRVGRTENGNYYPFEMTQTITTSGANFYVSQVQDTNS
mgnify:CR=1 FL=1